MLAAEYEARRENPFWRAVLLHFGDKLHLVPSIDVVLGRGIISVVLLEGDPDYLASSLLFVPPSWPVLLLLPSGWSRPTLPQVQWLSVTHRQCGGVTTARVHVGRRGIPPLFFHVTTRRTLGSIISHSIRPSPCGAPTIPDPYYSCDDQLHTRALFKSIRLSTHFSKTGWGCRPLTEEEIGTAFDLPLWVINDSIAFRWWSSHMIHPRVTPIKIPALVLNSALPHLDPVLIHHTSTAGNKHGGPSSPFRPCKRGRWLTPLSETVQDGVLGTTFSFLPAFLPHDAWLDDSKIADIAVKADDALAPFWIWDGRIRGIYPWITDSALSGFRLLALLWWRRSLVRSFLAYLRLRFGANWPALVASSPLQGGGGVFQFRFVSRPASRWPLCLVPTSSFHLVGLGCGFFVDFLALERPLPTSRCLVWHSHPCHRCSSFLSSASACPSCGHAPSSFQEIINRARAWLFGRCLSSLQHDRLFRCSKRRQ